MPSADMGRVWGSLMRAIDKKNGTAVESAYYYAVGDVIAAANDPTFRKDLEATLALNNIHIDCQPGAIAGLLLSVLNAFVVSRGWSPMGDRTYMMWDDKSCTQLDFRSGPRIKKPRPRKPYRGFKAKIREFYLEDRIIRKDGEQGVIEAFTPGGMLARMDATNAPAIVLDDDVVTIIPGPRARKRRR